MTTPTLHVYKSILEKNVKDLQDALPNCDLYYAVKAFSDPGVLSILNNTGIKFDVATNCEIDTCLGVGISCFNMLHTHPIKKKEDIIYAINHGINGFVVDNKWEIDKFVDTCAEVILRVSFPNPTLRIDLSKKFGCVPDQIDMLIRYAIAKGVTIKGLSFHVGSNSNDSYRHVHAIDVCKEYFDKYDFLKILDIGGGFPVSYDGTKFSIKEFCAPIVEAYEYYPKHVKVIAEPGRFIVGNAAVGEFTVVGKNIRNGTPWYYLDDGIYGLFSSHMFDHVTHRISHDKEDQPLIESVLTGPTCDSIDVMYESIMLPELHIGDILYADTMGAYCYATSTTFNSIPKAKIIIHE